MFQRCIIDMLEDPEVVSTMLMPGKRIRFISCFILFKVDLRSEEMKY